MPLQVPSGQGNPGLSFFKAFQDLIQRPNDPGQSAQARSNAQPTDRVDSAEKPRTDVRMANRPADPADAAARAAEFGQPVPRGSFVDLRV